MAKFVYFFAPSQAEGNKDMKDLLGGKGANLAEMAGAGLPVPPGFTVTTEVCNTLHQVGREAPGRGRAPRSRPASGSSKRCPGKTFGDPANPLLVSVRSGSKFSMPGMMDTILNLGLNDQTVEGLARKTGDRRFALDCYRRLIHMFSDVVLGIPKKKFEEILHAHKKKFRVKLDNELTEKMLEKVIAAYRELVRAEAGRDFPQDVNEQLRLAVDAVFKSWNNPRAITYRRLNHIADDLGTAVNVQLMVFGNSGDKSGTGVGFTRNPATGEKVLYGEYLLNAQGEDVVAGVRTPSPIKKLHDGDARGLRPAQQHHDEPRAPLRGRPGLRVHDPGRQALHAPDPERQADRPGGRPDRRRPRRGRPDDQGQGAPPGRARGPEPAPASGFRPRGEEEAPRPGQGVGRFPRGGRRPGRVHRRGGRASGKRKAERSSSSGPKRRPTTSTA